MRAPEDSQPAFESAPLRRSFDRHLAWGLVFMLVLVGGFAAYKIREPSLRAHAATEQTRTYTKLGNQLFAANCATCHGQNGVGGDGPRLNAKEFLQSVSDEQMRLLISGGVSGTAMPAWSIDFGGTLTDEQIRQVITYIRAWQPTAPSVPNWRQGAAK
ncbi:MAG: c-type cytochrome [Actinomycetota bacterium]